MKRQKFDPIFFQKFHIRTKIRYIPDVKVSKKNEKNFQKSYQRFVKKNKMGLSLTRKKQCRAMIDYLQKYKTDEKFREKVEIRWIDSSMGYGVFAKENIGPYTLLNHYAGIFKTDDEISNENDSVFQIDDFKYAIDGFSQGNWTRFMNHTDKEMNVVAWEYFAKDYPRIIFTTNHRGVKKGQQLLYSYGESYWDVVDEIF